MLDREVQRFATAIKEERNRLREKRREVIERIRPPWLSPLVRKLRGFLERLPEEQYIAFLTRWEITDEALSRWLDALTTGIDLDDADLVERVRRLETAPAAILDAFGVVRDAVPSDEDTSTPSVQLELALEPVVHRIEARLKSLRINLPTQQPVPDTNRLSRRKAGYSGKQNLK
jgi:hypothetical protein